MIPENPRESAYSENEISILTEELRIRQKFLHEKASALTRFLKFSLSLAGTNLNGIADLIERVRCLTEEIKNFDDH